MCRRAKKIMEKKSEVLCLWCGKTPRTEWEKKYTKLYFHCIECDEGYFDISDDQIDDRINKAKKRSI